MEGDQRKREKEGEEVEGKGCGGREEVGDEGVEEADSAGRRHWAGVAEQAPLLSPCEVDSVAAHGAVWMRSTRPARPWPPSALRSARVQVAYWMLHCV